MEAKEFEWRQTNEIGIHCTSAEENWRRDCEIDGLFAGNVVLERYVDRDWLCFGLLARACRSLAGWPDGGFAAVVSVVVSSCLAVRNARIQECSVVCFP